MGDISYQPSFRHADWVDNEDNVRAEEPNGFNLRFNTIESDLQQLSTVVGRIDTALDQLGTLPPPTPQRLIVNQALLAAGGNWTGGFQGVVEATPGTTATGIMGVVLPDGVRLISFRALGLSDGVSVFVAFGRVDVTGGTQSAALATITNGTSSYDQTKTIDATLARTDNTAFRYIVGATTGNTLQDKVRATVAGVQIVYIAD